MEHAPGEPSSHGKSKGKRRGRGGKDNNLPVPRFQINWLDESICTNSRIAFKSHTNYVISHGSAETLSAGSSSTSAHTPNTMSLLNDEIDGLSSEGLTWPDMKDELAIAKLNVYLQEKEYRFIREERAHRREEAAIAYQRLQEDTAIAHQCLQEDTAIAHQRSQEDKAIAHQRLQEATDKAIRLREAEAKAYALEVKVLQLKIQLHELSKQSKD